jgi:hypothetical protein
VRTFYHQVPKHELKTWPEPFDSVAEGKKTYELRVNDRGFQSGDLLLLRRYDPMTRRYTGRELSARIGYITIGGEWGLPAGLCVFSLLDVKEES